MSLSKFNPRTVVILGIILLAAILRITGAGSTLSPLANFSPIGAMALFGGTYYSTKWKGFLVPLLTLFISDIVMMQTIYKGYGNGNTILYSGWYWVYGAFTVMVLMGQLIKKVTVTNVLIAAISAALCHWLITDFGAWMSGCTSIVSGQPLPKTWAGLVQCYIQGIPYVKNMLIGNIIYSALFFGGFELLQKRYPLLQLKTA